MVPIRPHIDRSAAGYKPTVATRPRELDRTPGRVMFIYVMWVFVWYDPDWWLASKGLGTAVVKFYVVLFIPVCFLLMKYMRRGVIFWPYVVMIGIFLVWMPFVLNRGFLMNDFQKVLQYMLLTALTVACLETPRQVSTLLKLFLFQFIWFSVQGLPSAKVVWHQNLANHDSYGPLMTIGVAFAYFLAMGTRIKKYRYVALLVCFLGVAGTILAFARGAILALCLVFVILAFRTRRKLAFIGIGGLLGVASLVVISVMFPAGQFWNEMATITDEGISSGTGEQRWVLWTAAWEMFLHHPFLGVGPGNFGPNAVEFFIERGVTNMGGGFHSPAMLYVRSVHNDYVLVMVEQGLLGLFAMAAVLFHFFKSVRFLRTEAVQTAWANNAGGIIDSNNLARALEAAMIAFMATAFFYPQVYINHWMWSIVMLALVSSSVARRLVERSVDMHHSESSGRAAGLPGSGNKKPTGSYSVSESSGAPPFRRRHRF